MKIRKAKKEDIEIIDKIYCEGIFDEVKLQFPKKTKKEIFSNLKKHKEERIKEFKKDFISDLNYLIILEEDNKIVAFGQTEINKYYNKKAEIEKVYVLKEYRKNGFASKIMKELLKWLKNKEVVSITSGIFIKNTPSIKMHEKFGFGVTAVRLQKKFKK
jgi:aminoglycoside 6'-N-acetyltransferase I